MQQIKKLKENHDVMLPKHQAPGQDSHTYYNPMTMKTKYYTLPAKGRSDNCNVNFNVFFNKKGGIHSHKLV